MAKKNESSNQAKEAKTPKETTPIVQKNDSPKSGTTPGVAADGSNVKVHYKGSLADGSVFDSSQGREPITFVLGQHQVIPGFENAIKGMKKGEKKQLLVPCKEAYGDRNPTLIQKVPVEALTKAGIRPQKGMILALQHPARPEMQLPAKILEIDENVVIIDLNHPLAGKDLTFELELVSME